MRIDDPQTREFYRERLYQHYLVNCRGVDQQEARGALHSAAPYLKRLIRNHMPPDRNVKIVDLGCGFGALLYWLQQAGYTNLEGVDRSGEQVEGAHSLGLDYVRQGDITKHLAGSPASSCDLIFAFDVLEHFGKEEAMQFADEVLRVLRPGGRFILHLPNGTGSFAGTVTYGDFTHELILNQRSIAQLLRCVGFSEIKSYEDVPVVHGFASAVRYVVWKIYKTMKWLVYVAETGEYAEDLILTQCFLTVARK
jgi:SAM-dependent methyltransferase